MHLQKIDRKNTPDLYISKILPAILYIDYVNMVLLS